MTSRFRRRAEVSRQSDAWLEKCELFYFIKFYVTNPTDVLKGSSESQTM